MVVMAVKPCGDTPKRCGVHFLGGWMVLGTTSGQSCSKGKQHLQGFPASQCPLPPHPLAPLHQLPGLYTCDSYLEHSILNYLNMASQFSLLIQTNSPGTKMSLFVPSEA